MNSPKVLFQRTPAVKQFAAIVAEGWFQEALTAAYAHMAWTQPKGQHTVESWDAHNRLVGARDFITKLTSLHVLESEKPEPQKTGLTYTMPSTGHFSKQSSDKK